MFLHGIKDFIFYCISVFKFIRILKQPVMLDTAGAPPYNFTGFSDRPILA